MGRPLPLWPGAQPCVGSGMCCKTSPCAFGEWDAEAHRCKFLVDKEDGTYDCGKYEEILAMPQSDWADNPAFGAGCCSTLFNENRQRIIKRLQVKAGCDLTG